MGTHEGLSGLQVVNKYIDQGTAELVPGVLFVDEVVLASSAPSGWLGANSLDRCRSTCSISSASRS